MAYQQKSKVEDQEVLDYILGLEPEGRRQDALTLHELFKKVTGQSARLWTGGIIGFGQYHYTYASGHSGSASRLAFAPRKGKISLYTLLDSKEQPEILSRLGKHKAAVGCLYVNKLADIDQGVLEELLRLTWQRMGELYPMIQDA